jgi:hypothetical protein
MRKGKFAAIGTGAAAAVGLLAMFAAPASASAAATPQARPAAAIRTVAKVPIAKAKAVRPDQAGNFELCSEGGYYSYASFPDRGGASTYLVPNGWCYVFPYGGNSNEQVNVYDANNNQYIGSTIYNGSVGETIVTIPGPSFYAYNG